MFSIIFFIFCVFFYNLYFFIHNTPKASPEGYTHPTEEDTRTVYMWIDFSFKLFLSFSTIYKGNSDYAYQWPEAEFMSVDKHSYLS